MRSYFQLLIIFSIIFPSIINAQEFNAPFYSNFKTDQLNLSYSNTNVVIDENGTIIIANIEGLVLKNGRKWAGITVDHNDVVFGLHVNHKNQIFYSSNRAFGFLYSDSTGSLRNKIINHNIPSRIKRIISIRDSTVFLANDFIYINYKNRITKIQAKNTYFQNIFNFNDTLFVKEIGEPIKGISADSIFDIDNKRFPPNELVLTPFKYNKNNYFFSYPLLIPFSYNHIGGINEIEQKDLTLIKKLKNALPYQILQVDSSLAISTRKKGLIIIEPDSSIYALSEQNGLPSNITAGIENDNQNGLWVATQNGVSRIELNKRWNHWNSINGLKDLILSINRFNGRIYASCTEGVFYYDNQKWKKVKGLNSRTFNLTPLKDHLLMNAPDQGIFTTSDSVSKEVPEFTSTWTSAKYKANNAIIPVEGEGVFMLNIEDSIYAINKILNAKLGTPYDIKMINDTSAWISIKWDGLVLFKTTESGAQLKYFNEEHGLPNTNEFQILRSNNSFIFGTSKGFYHLNNNPSSDSSDLFIPVPYLSVRKPILKTAIDRKGNIWFATTNKYKEQVLKKLEKRGVNDFIDSSHGLQRLPNQVINQIYPDPEQNGVVWVAGNKGLFRYDENIKLDISKSFQTVINEVSSNDSTIFHGFYSVPNEDGPPSLVADQPKAYIPILDYSSNNIKFEFSSNAYTLSDKNTFSYKLEGLENNWSNWTRSTQKEFSNLAPGTYTFKIRSKNLYGVEGKATFYKFIITPPWYLTTWAKIFFTILCLFIIWLVVMIYAYRLRQHRKHLKLLVADRTFEVMAQKKEIEKQYKQLSEQTEEILLQSEQIEIKNKELQESKEEVDLINTQLEEMNKHLERKVEKRTIKIKSTLEKLKETNKELDTFIYKASHDLKGPLSRIVGLTGLAKIETPTAKNTQYLELIERTSKDMDLLLSKLTQAHELFNQQAKIVPLLIEEILEEIKSNLSYLYSQEETDIQLENLINEPIKADHQLFYTVLFNLIENSLIFKNPDTDKKHVIGIKIFREKNRVILKVSDNGIGIEEDLIYAVFNMFYRASDRSKGSGLGLYLVKIAIEKMKGEIDVESNYLEYTTFTVSLPQ